MKKVCDQFLPVDGLQLTEYEVVNYVYYIKTKYNLSHSDLSELIDVSRPTLYKYQNIDSTLSIPEKALHKLASTQGFKSINDLIDLEKILFIAEIQHKPILDELFNDAFDMIIPDEYLTVYKVNPDSEIQFNGFYSLRHEYDLYRLWHEVITSVRMDRKLQIYNTKAHQKGDLFILPKHNSDAYNELLLNLLNNLKLKDDFGLLQVMQKYVKSNTDF